MLKAIILAAAALATLAAAGIDSVTQVPSSATGVVTVDKAAGITLYAYVTKMGVTNFTGQGSGLGCQALVGKVKSFGGSWDSQTYMMLSYDSDAGNADRWALHWVPAIGKYEVAMHCWDYFGSDVWATSTGGNARIQVVGCGDWTVQSDEECDVGGAAAYGCTSDCKCEPGHVASPTGAYWGCKQTKHMPADQSSIWRTRSIYQVLTDRFATSSDAAAQPCNVTKNTYCGGTFAGLKNHLDYITGMGFDAIWISPVVENIANGWHGYWAKNFQKINTNFGTLADLQDLVKECHKRGVLVMMDWVSNHVGIVDISQIDTFNSSEYYHPCDSCPSWCSISDYDNMAQVEMCRLSGLLDLNTEHPFVVSKLKSFVASIIKSTGVDALRLDTVPHVNLNYWEDFRSSVNTFMMGEVFDGRAERGAAFQNPLDSLLWYPMYYAIRNVFGSKADASQLDTVLKTSRASYLDTTVLGNFVDNHDNARFLNSQPDKVLFRNALAMSILGEGIPIVYYGSEQGFNGGSDPANREALWSSQFSTSTDLYAFIAQLNAARKKSWAFAFPQSTLVAQSNLYAFTRGKLAVFLRNGGSSAPASEVTFAVPRNIVPGIYVSATPAVSYILNIFPGTTLTVRLPAGGEPLVFYQLF